MNLNDFIKELEKINIKPTKNQLNQLEKYYELLIEYNKVMNLTGITEKKEVYLKHFYDSLTLHKVIDLSSNYTLCDIGSGAGFPGIVLKIIFPNLKITLIDSLNKRIKFLNKVIEELELEGIEAISFRIEEYGKINREKFDLVTARAVAQVNILLEYAIPLLKVNGKFIAMKAQVDENYKNAMIKLNCTLIKEQQFLLPIEKSNRKLLVFEKKAKTQKKYPRNYANIKNQPL